MSLADLHIQMTKLLDCFDKQISYFRERGIVGEDTAPKEAARRHQVKVFSGGNRSQFEEDINSFLKTMGKENNSFILHDIKYNADNDGWVYAMVVYSTTEPAVDSVGQTR